ncbi:MAG: PAS domain-containing hybrid sensor histidine kinase/response regulator [Chlorobiales bacterium]
MAMNLSNSASANVHSASPDAHIHHRLPVSVLNQIYQKAGDAILIFDPHSEQVLEVNETACTLYGYTYEEFRSLSMKQLTKDIERGTKALESLLSGEDIGNFETVQYKKNGDEIILLCKASLIEYDGKTAILSINRDVTSEHRKHAEMLEKSMMLDLMVKASRVGFYILDLETHHLYFSPSYKAQLGYSDDEFPNELDAWKSHLHPDDAEFAIQAVNQLMCGKIEQFELLHRLRHKDGDYRWIVCNSTAIQNSNNAPVKIIGVHLDVTSLCRKDIALQDSEEKFKRIFRRVPVAISLVDVESKQFLEINESFEQIFELKRGNVIGKTMLEVFPDIPTEHTMRIKNCIAHNIYLENTDYEYLSPSGKKRFLIYSAEPLMLAGRKCLIFVINDVTAQRLAQAEQEQLKEQLFQSQKLEAIGTLASGIAHDFNNVLGIIKMSSGILRYKLSNPDFLRYLTSIEEATERGVNISRQLLTFARHEEPKMELVSVQTVIEQVITMLRHSIPKTIDIQLHTLTTNIFIKGDSTKLYQAMLNLGINARDAMPNGGELCYEISQVSSKSMESKFGKKFETPFLLVKVTDTGIGMSPEVKRRIFEPFFTTKPSGKGTGLGLSIIHGVVKSHNGYIEVESEVGKGTSFLCYFPLLHAVETPESKPQVGKTILLVDDEPDLRELLSDILTERNFCVVVAKNGAEGLSTFLNSPSDIDFVLADLNMPRLSGKEMLLEMKHAKPDLKFAVLTGFLTQETHLELKNLKALSVLQKPIQIDDLFALLDEAFGV